MNLYLGSPSKLPIFAHGLGFIVSRDLAELLADLGLSFKLRGNDDMLVGMWLRNVEDVRFLHYHPWFHDHHEFKGLFARSCQKDAIIVHRMTPERWRTFDKQQCHICGDVKPLAHACALSDALEPSATELVGEAAEEMQEVTAEGLARLEQSRQEQKKEREAKHSRDLKLAILIFGSRWQDFRLRAHLRAALRRAKSNFDFKSSFEWLFVMAQLPADWSLHLALRETLLRRDLVTLGPARIPRQSQAAKARPTRSTHRKLEDERGGHRGCYRYEEAWRLVEERWIGVDFVLLLDHRSYVNVPRLMAQIPTWPRHRRDIPSCQVLASM